jgi:hypothetical protein
MQKLCQWTRSATAYVPYAMKLNEQKGRVYPGSM